MTVVSNEQIAQVDALTSTGATVPEAMRQLGLEGTITPQAVYQRLSRRRREFEKDGVDVGPHAEELRRLRMAHTISNQVTGLLDTIDLECLTVPIVEAQRAAANLRKWVDDALFCLEDDLKNGREVA